MEKTLLYKHQNFTQTDVDDAVKFIETIDEKPTLIRKICFLTVEILQNIIHHSDKNENGNTFAYYELIKNDTYIIKSGNLISKEHTNELEEKLNDVQQSSGDELKEKINDKLMNENFTDKGGAGIGLLSIKKRVNDGMSYNIEYFLEKYNMIHFEIRI